MAGERGALDEDGRLGREALAVLVWLLGLLDGRGQRDQLLSQRVGVLGREPVGVRSARQRGGGGDGVLPRSACQQ